MSDFVKAIILGIVEGVTEFIPVSSTGHLILVGNALDFEGASTATFSIAIQLGAILAVVFLYWSYFKTFLHWRTWISKRGRIMATAIVPALGAGFFMHGIIKTHLFSPGTVIAALFVGGIIMLVVDRFGHPAFGQDDIDDISYRQALIVGVAQCAALWPGMSRSGSTIVGGLLAGLSYKTAAEFSFIIAVPVMIAAVSYDLLKSAHLLNSHDLSLIGVGFTISLVVAWLSIVTFLGILKRFKLSPFAIYRIALAVIVYTLVLP